MIVETKKGKLPVRYGMNALAHFGDLTGKSMNVVMKSMGDLGDMQLSELLAFIYAGFVDGARYTKEDCKIEGVEEVGDMIDDDSDLVSKMFEAFNGDSEEVKGDVKKN
jgi:hypothetical protein